MEFDAFSSERRNEVLIAIIERESCNDASRCMLVKWKIAIRWWHQENMHWRMECVSLIFTGSSFPWSLSLTQWSGCQKTHIKIVRIQVYIFCWIIQVSRHWKPIYSLSDQIIDHIISWSLLPYRMLSIYWSICGYIDNTNWMQ